MKKLRAHPQRRSPSDRRAGPEGRAPRARRRGRRQHGQRGGSRARRRRALAANGSDVTDRAFRVQSPFQPAGDQPAAIEALSRGVQDGLRFQTLEGITGSGKTATIAWVVEQLQRPTLVIEPNKSLAAQLAAELREMLPDNRVEFFVSYYDYYQPEAYIARTDTYIEKDSSINDEIDRLRHASTSSLLTRRDTVVVASVSCIYGLGSPEESRAGMLPLVPGEQYDQRELLHRLVDMQYSRNDMTLLRGTFRVRGDTVEVHPSYEQVAIRLSFFGDTLELTLGGE